MKNFLLFSAVAAFICSTVYAQPGSLDRRFGEDGIIQKPFSFATGKPKLAIQKDGKIVSSIFVLQDTLHLYRFNPDGSPDLDFGDNGISSTIVYNATGMALQQDGKIIVVGKGVSGIGYQFRRFLPNGQLDSAFGINGTKVGTFGGVSTYTSDIAIQDDNKIVTSGLFSDDGTREDIFVARFMPDGSVDSSFGDENGMTRTIDGYGPTKIAFQKDGKIVLAGSDRGEYSNSSRFLLARFTSDGIFDSSFGEAGTGIVKTDYDKDGDFIRDIVMQPDDKVVVVGTALTGGFGNKISYIAMARYLKDGVLDPSFGEGGKVKLKLSEDSDGYGVDLQTNDKIVVCGTASFTNANYVLARYLSDGTPDSSFGENGIVQTDIDPNSAGGYSEIAHDLVILQTGRIVVVGAPGLTLLGFEGDQPGIITKIKRWIRNHILNFSDANGTATQYIIEQQNSGGGFSTIASVLPNKNNSYSYDISNYSSTTANSNFRIKAVYADGSTVYSDIVTEAALQTSIKPSVYPNPAASVITINGLDKNKNYNIIISNKEAQPLLQTAAKAVAQKQINIAMLNAGIYFIELKDDVGGVVRLKLVKE